MSSTFIKKSLFGQCDPSPGQKKVKTAFKEETNRISQLSEYKVNFLGRIAGLKSDHLEILMDSKRSFFDRTTDFSLLDPISRFLNEIEANHHSEQFSRDISYRKRISIITTPLSISFAIHLLSLNGSPLFLSVLFSYLQTWLVVLASITMIVSWCTYEKGPQVMPNTQKP